MVNKLSNHLTLVFDLSYCCERGKMGGQRI